MKYNAKYWQEILKEALSLSEEYRKKRKLKALKNRINKRVDQELVRGKRKKYALPPRYDEIFFEGLECLNRL